MKSRGIKPGKGYKIGRNAGQCDSTVKCQHLGGAGMPALAGLFLRLLK